MDFARVITMLSAFAEARAYPFAVIGGVCMAAYGRARTTLDLDVVFSTEAQAALIAHLADLGYETLHVSSGYSNHLHPDPNRGRIDVVYIGGTTRDKLFSATRNIRGPGSQMIAVPSPEHVAAMKVFAMKNDPSRSNQELDDIRFLLGLPGVDRMEIRAYFVKHGMESRYDEIA